MTTEQRKKAKSSKSVAGRAKRLIFAALGFAFFGLAAVGAFLPVLPTTPFLLLAAACFSRSSKRFDDWLKGTKLYQKYLANFMANRALTLKSKLSICALASTMVAVSFILTANLLVRIALVAIILFMYYYFAFRIKTIAKTTSGKDAADSLSQGQERKGLDYEQ